MKKIKKTMTYLFALTCCFSVTNNFPEKYIKNSVVVNAEKEQEEKIYNNYSYIVHDKMEGVCDTPCVEIIKFHPSGTRNTNVPANIDGYPVVSLAGDTFKESSVQINIPSSIKHFGKGFIDNLSDGNVTIDDKFDFSINSVIDDDNVITFDNFILTYCHPSYEKEDIEIPETVLGLPVTAIGDDAFADNQSIKSVKIPDTVNYFGKKIFRDTSVQSVNIPKALKVLTIKTFENCSELKSVEFHDNMIVSPDAFYNTDFKIPDNVFVAQNAFALASYDLLEYCCDDYTLNIYYDYYTQRYVSDLAYQNVNYILNTPDIVIPEFLYDIPVISASLFLKGNESASDININSITFSPEIAVIKNINENVSVNNGVIKIKKAIINGNNTIIDINAFNNTDIEEVIINGSCRMEISAFMNHNTLKKVEFTGDNQTISIGNYAFKNCTSLETFTFPENATADIESDAFRDCSALKEITLSGNTHIDEYAFRECTGLEKLTIKGDTTLDKNAFFGCQHLTDIIIDTDVPINGSAFNTCTKLMNINSVPAFDTSANTFYPEINDFLFNNFNNADDVGFINLYIQARVNDFVDNYIDDSMNDMQKIKAAHDWVCNNTIYDENISLLKNHNDASVFMNDKSVCEGYAKCYNLLLNAAGIESYFLINEKHAWNVVKLGGHYFHSDTTWDDGDTISYDWFLKSDDDMLAETSSHGVWTLNIPSSMHSFQKETLPECKYKMGDVNTDGKINVSDLVVMNKYLTESFPINSSDLTYDGVIDVFDLVCMRQLINKYLTGQASINADDIVLFDLTYDGVVDVFDLVLMRKLILNK